MNSPIYKDFYYTASTATLEYAVVTDGVTIFRGKAWRNPDTNVIKINIADIIRDWLSFSELPDFRALDSVVTKQEEAYKVFTLYNASSGSQLAEYKVLFDWTGEWNGEWKVLSNPINGVLDPRMKALWTVYSPTDSDINMDGVPTVVNTFFRLLTQTLTISAFGGNYPIYFRTDYYPYTDIGIYASGGISVEGINKTSSGMTVTFPKSPNILQERNFNLYVYYQNRSNVLGTIRVTQLPVYFNLLTTQVYAAPGGGVYPVYWDTEIPEVNIMLSTNSGVIPLSFSDATATGTSVQVGANQYTTDHNSYLSIYYGNYYAPEAWLYLSSVTITSYGINQDDALYVNEIQIPGTRTPGYNFDAMRAYTPHNAPVEYKFRLIGGTNYFYISGYTGADNWYYSMGGLIVNSGRTYGAQLGFAESMEMYRVEDPSRVGYISMKVTSVWGTNANPSSTPTGYEMKDAISLRFNRTYTPTVYNILGGELNGYSYGMYKDTSYDYDSYGIVINWRTILAEEYAVQSVGYVLQEIDDGGDDRDFSGITFHKTVKTNSIGLHLEQNFNDGFALELNYPEYIGYYITNVNHTGPLDIYVQDTMAWFLSIPRVDRSRSGTQYSLYDTAQSSKARWFIAKRSTVSNPVTDTITVHCTDGDIIWTADELV